MMLFAGRRHKNNVFKRNRTHGTACYLRSGVPDMPKQVLFSVQVALSHNMLNGEDYVDKKRVFMPTRKVFMHIT